MTFPAFLRVHLIYLWRHRRVLRLQAPRRFTDWVQHRKLYDRDPRLPELVDKVAVKALVAATLGPEWVIPTLWHGRVLPVEPPAPLPLVIKARQGCGHVAFVWTLAEWQAGSAQAARWSDARYGRWLDEWAYRDVPPGLLVEPYIGHGETLPVDYKLFVFGGRAAFVQVHLDRATAHRWIVMDRDWVRVSPPTRDPDPSRPVTLDRLIAGAERLARGFSFLRIDCYEVGGRPLSAKRPSIRGPGCCRSCRRRLIDRWARSGRRRGTIRAVRDAVRWDQARPITIVSGSPRRPSASASTELAGNPARAR